MNQQLLTQIKHGDTAAFAQAVQALQHPLFNYLGRMGLEQATAEDIAQETFVRAWQARQQFDPTKSAYSTWVFTIARRLALNELDRAWRRHEQPNTTPEAQSDLSTKQSQTKSPSATLEQQELNNLLQSALSTLPVRERSLLALAYISELELADIGRIEDIPTGTVKSRLHRIRGKLKTLIGNPEA